MFYMQDELILGLITTITSTITAILGAGGGMVLIAILPNFLSPNNIVPIHGATQFASNFSRALFGYKHIYYKALLKFLLGSLIGAGIFAYFLSLISFKYIPLFIGLYILLSLWSKNFTKLIENLESYFLIGLIQSGISLIVGATGAMSMPLLLKDCKKMDEIVASAAAFASVTHFLKIIVFIFLGFKFFTHLPLMLTMIFAAILGSYLGTIIRKKYSGAKLKFILKIILTILATKSIIFTFVSI